MNKPVVVIDISSDEEEKILHAKVRKENTPMKDENKKTKNKNNNGSEEEDDDCVILYYDPFESIDVSNKLSIKENEKNVDDDDDVCIVAEKGQMMGVVCENEITRWLFVTIRIRGISVLSCRLILLLITITVASTSLPCGTLFALISPPVPNTDRYMDRLKHMLEFIATFNNSHGESPIKILPCPQNACYCYVCDAAAPCKFWLNTLGGHCHATENCANWVSMREAARPAPAHDKTTLPSTLP
ncbi:hypothetical protein IFM89_003549 [Coptis chinensis]|uniref:Uncharacterized protein n=1 Tax=Coptis chinensis TaxID=261450 RepID=A0A835IVV7_9MAGN|nr:hypothetical protein IFM89_003549 [Coptis chinensis]